MTTAILFSISLLLQSGFLEQEVVERRRVQRALEVRGDQKFCVLGGTCTRMISIQADVGAMLVGAFAGGCVGTDLVFVHYNGVSFYCETVIC